MNKKNSWTKNVFYWITVFLLGLVIVLFLSAGNKNDESLSFFQRLGIEAEKIERVTFSYKGQPVELGESDQKMFLETLALAQAVTIDDAHEFKPSDLSVSFYVGKKEYPVTFYWFSYYLPLNDTYGVKSSKDYSISQGEAIGNRFDILLNGKKYSYRFTSENVWTEEMSRTVYDQCAIEQDLQTMVELDGGDLGFDMRGLYQQSQPLLEDVLEDADLILTGTCTKKLLCSDVLSHPYSGYDMFQVTEVLKGDYDEKTYLMESNTSWEYYVDWRERINIGYESAYDPAFEINQQYLICVDYDKGYADFFGQYGTAVIDNDTLFPRFNTEHHPFYNVELDEIRQLIAQNEK